MQGRAGILTACIAFCAAGAYGQIITFNGPLPWVTQRNDSITVRAQIDTAQLKKKKEISLSASLVNDRMQKKPLARKTFAVSDYTGEFALGTVKQNLAGGRSYIRVDWSIPGTDSKGVIAPIGIVALDMLPQPDVITVPHAPEGADAAGVAAALKDNNFKTAGTAKFAFAWNKDGFYIVLIKKQAPGTARFAFDGKNGKSAFLSFADRAVLYWPDKDSLSGVHFSPLMAGDTLKYTEKPWPNELTKTAAGDKIVIRVPWFDTGIIPFEERKMGMGIMTFDAKGKQTAALPAKADFFLPGTWCDLLLAK